MYLLINTCVEKKIIFAIKHCQKIIQKEILVKDRQGEKMIKELDRFLVKNHLTLKNVDGIITINGPGKFTALRAGVSIANGLAYALKIQVIGLAFNEFDSIADVFSLAEKKFKIKKNIGSCVSPAYGKEPNIFIKKAKKQENKKTKNQLIGV